MMRITIFIAALIFFPLSLQAAKRALIITGASKNRNGGPHDFIRYSAAAALCLKESGYDVTSLAGPGKSDSERLVSEYIKQQKNAQARLQKLVDNSPDKNNGEIQKQQAEITRITEELKLQTTNPEEFQTMVQQSKIARKHALIFQADGYEHFKKDYDFLYSQGLRQGAATSDEIDRQLEQLAQTTDAGDEVELLISGHGTCATDSQAHFQKIDVETHDNKIIASTTSQSAKENCDHEITMFNGSDESQYKTKKLMEYVKQMDAKGVKVNLVIDSCFSAGLRKDTDVKLSNGCIFFGAGTNTLGYSCMSGDPPEIKDYTSAVTPMQLRSCKGNLKQFNDNQKYGNYFSDDECFKKEEKYFASANPPIDYSSMKSTYLTARQNDLSFGAPSLNCIADDLVATGLIAQTLEKHYNYVSTPGDKLAGAHLGRDQFICLQKIETALSRFIADVSNTQVTSAIDLFRKAVIKYNDNIEQQMPIIERLSKSAQSKKENKESFDSDIEQLSTIQNNTRELATSVVKAERQLLQTLMTFHPEIFSACDQACNNTDAGRDKK